MINLLDVPGVFLADITAGNQLPALITTLIILLIICAGASAAETSLTSVNRIRMQNLAEDGNARAQSVEKFLENPKQLLTTILVVNNISLILASSIATVIAITFSPQWGDVIASVIMSVVALIFCEITPKSAAVQSADAWALFFAPVVVAVGWLLKPVIFSFNFITELLLRILNVKIRDKGPSVTEEELKMLVNVSKNEGVLEEEERSMITHIFGLSDTSVRSVMTPRIDMITLESDASITQAVELFIKAGLSRIPMYEDTIDNIVGMLYAKDLLIAIQSEIPDAPAKHYMRQAYFVPETKKLDDLLHEMRSKRIHIAIIIDEYGAVAGLVTIEDLVEEIVGEIQDEYDLDESPIQKTGASEYLIDAMVSVEDFNEETGAHLEIGEEYDSLAGYVQTKLDKIPSYGDSVSADGVTLTVNALRGKRITQLKAIIHEPLRLRPAELPDLADDEPEQQRPNGNITA